MKLKFPIPNELFELNDLHLYDVRGIRSIQHLDGYGRCVPNHTKIEESRERRLELLRMRIDGLDPETLFTIGMSLFLSNDPKDREHKIIYTERYLCGAADQGHMYACYNLGYYYEKKYIDNEKEGNYTKDKAKSYYKKAADKGLLIASHNLARLSIGFGSKEEINEAIESFKKSARIKNSYSHIFLGLLHINGYGVQRDYAEGASWLKLSADSGNITAKGNLAVLYFLGKGVNQDLNLAIQNIIAHASKNFRSRALLAYAYANGIGGLEEDYISAYKWACLSTGKASELCTTLEKYLSYSECKIWKDYARDNWQKSH
jgi:TPR repeat protein